MKELERQQKEVRTFYSEIHTTHFLPADWSTVFVELLLIVCQSHSTNENVPVVMCR